MRFYRLKSIIIFFLILFFPLYSQASHFSHLFTSISDIHFNPFASCKSDSHDCPIIHQLIQQPYTQWEAIFNRYGQKKISTYSQDTNYALLKSLLNYSKSRSLQSKFVIISGDFLAHHFMKQYIFYTGDSSLKNYQFFVSKTFQFIVSELKNTFPNIPVYPVIGNNDSYDGDYYNNFHGMFYSMLITVWSPLFIHSYNKKAFLKMFSKEGYYSIVPDNQSHDRIIALNTVLFSAKAKGPKVDKAAKKEMKWLEQQLQMAAEMGNRIILVMHIPYGIDVFSTVTQSQKTPVLFWKKNYNDYFLMLLKKYAFEISGVLSGHTHMDSVEISSADVNHNHFIIDASTPAISPAFGNNPGFKVYRYDISNFTLKDFATYYLNLTSPSHQWKVEYDFDRLYQPFCHYCQLVDGALAIHENGILAEKYQHYYAVNTNSQPITKGDWLPYYWCGIYYQTLENYQRCVIKFHLKK